MTKDDVDALLGRLTRYAEMSNYDMTTDIEVDPEGEWVKFEDVRAMFEGIDAARQAGREG